MSASEDSEVDGGRDSSSSFTDHQPAQAQTLASASDQSSDPRQSGNESGFLPNIDNDRDSDDSLLTLGDDHQELDAEQSLGHDNLAEPADPFAAEESYYTRPNRHYGPASTWRSWTKDDRDVAESLELERAQNLSVHLYNAHALRLQAQKLQETSSRKRRRGTNETMDDESNIFGIPKVWTAWPMPPADVPRNHLTARVPDKWPRQDLEECLVSVATKAARERWDAREWQEEEQSKLQASAEQRGQQIGAPSNLLDENAPDVQTPSSQVFADDQSSPQNLDDASDNDFYGINPTARPTPLADDDKARRLLLPSTRHIISQLDHLLMALHHARQSYALPILTDKDDAITSSATDGESKSSGSSKKRRQRSDAQLASSISSVDTEASVQSSSSRRKKGVWKEGSRCRNRRFKRLGLRDWSDVLGTAALTGWNEDVVARASERCAELFGENMLFRTFHEAEHEVEKSHFTERLASGEEPLDGGEDGLKQNFRAQGTDEDKNSDVEAVTDLRFPCPIESCPRHETPFHTAGNLKQHMIRSHAQFEEDHKDGIVEAALRDARQVFCPVQTCRRSREPFSKGAKLYLHVRKVHPEVNVQVLKKLESQRRGENCGKRTREKRRKSPHERG